MLSVKERAWPKSLVERQTAQNVWNCIVEERVVTLEEIVERLPWIRWGDLFSILGRFRREGLISVHQVGSYLEVRLTEQA